MFDGVVKLFEFVELEIDGELIVSQVVEQAEDVGGGFFDDIDVA